ncbi:adenylosuccinate lyase [Thermaerobacter composti]|uniref:Adenylosuccinate lyase n=1 Tax=Thermaerobacter composti TaxID=554949 RepID=A0ABZ0QN31_9FIRM|nr:adenylosuccinate lyase [Thermaerobacter composti]WPD18197.1 adenylosuccinate lyase [Thermaerobacter composti]
MIERYTRPAMGRLWTLEHKYATWLEVELLALEAWEELGTVPRGTAARIRQRARIDVERILAIERRVHHDVIAFTTAIAEQVGDDARWVHYGLTSSDVVDTALAVNLVQAVDLLLAEVRTLREVVGEQARRHKDTVMVGRTHGVHAEPITFGVKLALWYAELGRGLERLARARRAVAVGKVSGAVGTFAHVDPRVEAYVCRRLGLEPETVSSQIVARDRHAELLAALAILAGTYDKMAIEIRHLQRTEVREVEEPFRAGQKGSSAMPHKRNPEKCERISGLARVIRGYLVSALENQALWHERDISHSSVERIVLPDALILADYMTALLTEIVRDLHVYPAAMAANLERTGGLIFSQRVLLALVERGLRREEAYALVQELAMRGWQGERPFRQLVAEDPRVRAVLSPSEIEALFDPKPYLRHVDFIFRRAGLLPDGGGGAAPRPGGAGATGGAATGPGGEAAAGDGPGQGPAGGDGGGATGDG